MPDEFDQYKSAPAGGDEFDQFKTGSTHPDNSSISPVPAPQGISDKLAKWAKNVQDDIKYGTDLTGVGSVLKKMGAHGVYNGVPEKVGDFMASLPLGLARTAQGAGEVGGGHIGQGIKDVAGGLSDAATIPSMIVGGPGVKTAAAAGQLAGIGGGAGALIAKGGQAALEALPSAERAGKTFADLKNVAQHVPINVSGPGNTALDMLDFSKTGAQLPKVIKDFITRVSNPAKGALNYPEARDFYTNATKLSSQERMSLSGPMQYKLGEFVRTLDSALSDAADTVGKLKDYRGAMEEYHQAMKLRAAKEAVKDVAKSTAVKAAVGTGLGTLAGFEAYKAFNK